MDSRDRVIRLIAEILEGLQVPLSIPGGHLGTARESTKQLRGELGLFGWPPADEIEQNLRKRLGIEL